MRENIANSFPEKSFAHRKKIEEKYFCHLCDLIVEGLKNFNISEKEVKQRFLIKNPELVDEYYRQGRHVIIIGGHYNNWELYALAMPLYHQTPGIALYKKIHNRFFDEKLRKSRGKFGLQMIPIREVKPYFQNSNQKYGFVFGADQSPKNPKNAYWMTFLNQETPLQYGAEKYAKENDAAVVFGKIKKEKRGYYSLQYELISEHPVELPYGAVIEAHTKILEDMILDKPEYWLWSHKRWKHKKISTPA